MSNFSNLSTSQGQAYLNEFKGNIFEFQVGLKLSEKFGVSSQFLNDIGDNQLQQLYLYEKSARAIDPKLGVKLTELAVHVVEHISPRFQKIDAIYIVGKSFAGTGDDSLNEADIIIKSDELQIPLSLKLCKHNAFVNTKSGGCRSFLKNYFKHSVAKKLQNEFSAFLDLKFNEFAHNLYNRHDLKWKGSFDGQWSNLSIGDLPSQLDEIDKRSLHYLYHDLKLKLHESFMQMFETDQQLFSDAILELCGFGNDQLVQVKCFHQNHIFKAIDIINYNKLKDCLESMQFVPFIGEKSSFSINLQKYLLQIRIKPMNKFTQPSFKVNCSMKLISGN